LNVLTVWISWCICFTGLTTFCSFYQNIQWILFSELVKFMQFHECPARAIVNVVREAFRLLRPGGTFAMTDNSVYKTIIKFFFSSFYAPIITNTNIINIAFCSQSQRSYRYFSIFSSWPYFIIIYWALYIAFPFIVIIN
jgi:SAM-dependent methyltransferase